MVAGEYTTKPLPGLGRFLIENSDFRNRWAYTIGQIAESHHWTIEEVEKRLGRTQSVPSPDGEPLDLGYLACVLRVIDYAHVNRQRALDLDRALRSEIPASSSVHWDAQAKITGPYREETLLVFSCTSPLEDIDAWWLFFRIASGLDAEIRGVRDYLRNRTSSASRFSLQGVKGAEDPTSFSSYVRLPGNIIPIDIRVQPDSMERVVQLLGGKQLYGEDRLAPLRELIQNARDAIELRNAVERADSGSVTNGRIVVSLEDRNGDPTLIVSDNGVGMRKKVVLKHLIGVASDFWNSVDFYQSFRKALDVGFRPIGKFGVGFLSVFMLGDEVHVETEGLGSNSRIDLTLHGVGRRGELRERPATGQVGTEVRITLKPEFQSLSPYLAQIVRARAPMLQIPILVNTIGASGLVSEQIDPGWWTRMGQAQLLEFARNWDYVALRGIRREDVRSDDPFRHGRFRYYGSTPDFGGQWSVIGWPGQKPDHVGTNERLISLGGEPAPGVMRCSQGIAIDLVHVPDVSGLLELGEVELTVDRESIASGFRGAVKVGADMTTRITGDIRPEVAAAVDQLHEFGMLPGRLKFLRGLASTYGTELLDLTTLRWIPVTVPPGNLIHHSKQEFVQLLASQGRILFAMGVSAGSAYSLAKPQIPANELGKLTLLAINIEEMKVDYQHKNKFEHEGNNDVLRGSLDELLSMLSESEAPFVLTPFLLRCIADAWGVTEEDLRDQDWRLNYKSDCFWADLVRP